METPPPPLPAPMPSRRGRVVLLALGKIAVSVALIVWLVGGIDLRALAARLVSVPPWALALAGALELTALCLATWRWRRVLAAVDLHMPYVVALRLMYIGQFINLVLPANVGGDAYRIWTVFRDGSRILRALMAVALDRLAALVGLALLAVPGIYVLAGLTAERAPVLALSAMAAGIIVATAAFLACGSAGIGSAMARFGALARPWSGLAEASRLARAVFLAPGTAFAVIGAAVAGHFLAVAGILVLAHGLGIGLGVGAAVALIPPVILASVLPVSYGGWGVREGAMALALGYAGIAPDAAIGLSLLFGGVTFVVTLPAGLWWLANPARSPAPPS